MTETLVAMLALIPAFWGAAYLGRLQDIQSAAVASSRYVTWERYAWHGGKSTATTERESRDRIFGNDRAALISHQALTRRGISVDPLRDDFDGQSLLASGRDGETVGGALAAPDTVDVDLTSGLVGAIAYGEFDHHTGAISSAATAIGLDGSMLGLEQDRVNTDTASIKVRDAMRERGHLTLSGLVNGGPRDPFTFRYDSGMFGGSWQAANEDDYQDRVEGIVGGSWLTTLTSHVLTAAGSFGGLFQEAKSGTDPDFVPDSNTILPEYETSSER